MIGAGNGRPAPISPIGDRTGLIRWVFDLPMQPGEPRIFNCAVKMAETSRYLDRPCYDNNGGSGLTREAARQSAIGEGLERYCASVYDPAALAFGSSRDLRAAHRVYPPARYALFHPAQRRGYPPFTEAVPLGWVWGFQMAEAAPVLVPACLVYMPYELPFRSQGEQLIGPSVSTGLACARSRPEALLKGIFECVERDAFMITWLNRLPMPRIDIASCPPLHALYEARLRRDGLTYVLIETTTDIPIPSFLCLLIDERRSPPMICAGGAAHLDPVQAAGKALLEAVQTREWAKFLGGDDAAPAFAPDFSDIRLFDDHVRLFAYGNMQDTVRFLLQEGPVVPRDWRNQGTGEAAVDLAATVALLAGQGLDVIALDLTTVDAAEAGYFVTRALLPSLQPLDADYSQRFLGGERLYQVPRRLGFTAADTTIDLLNPIPHPYP